MKKKKWRERILVNGKEYRAIYLIHACARDLLLPLNHGKKRIANAIRDKCPGVTGSDDHMILHYAHILDKKGVKLGRLQVLCQDCNLGKSNWDETDWRPFVE